MALGDFQLQRGSGGNGSNAVRIPITTQRTAAQGQANSQMRNIDMRTGSEQVTNALANVGQAFGTAATTLANVQKYEQDRDEYAAKLEATNVYSSGLIDLNKMYEDMKLKMPLGGSGFADSVLKATDEHIEMATKGKSEAFKQQYQQHANSLRVKMFDQAKHTEVVEGLKHESVVLDGLREKYSTVVREKKIPWAEASKELIGLIDANPKLTATAKEALKKSADQELRFADQLRRIKENAPEWAGKPPKEVSAGGGEVMSSTGTGPRNERNANPGNIEYGEFAKRHGAIGSDGRFAIFPNKAAGTAAMDALLQSYAQKDGLDTIAKIVQKWAPAGDGANDPEKYAAGVAKRIGVNANDKLDMSDPELRKKVGREMARIEGSEAAYNPDDKTPVSVKKGSASAAAGTGTGNQPAPDRGESWPGLTYDNQQKLERFADQELTRIHQEANRERQTWASNLQYEMQNLAAKTSEMIVDNSQWRTEEEFARAYADNQEQGRRAFSEYAEAKHTNEAIGSFKGAPSSVLQGVVKEAPPPEGDPDFATASRGQNARQKAAAAVLEARQKDPWSFAASQGDFGTKPLDPQKPLGEQLRMRSAAIPEMAKQYGFVPQSIFTAAETAQFAARIATASAGDKMKLLSDIRAGVADDRLYMGVLQSIAPDSPVTAQAGAIATQLPGSEMSVGGTPMKTEKIAKTILLGEELLNPPKSEKNKDGTGKRFELPKDKDLRAFWESSVGDAYAGFAPQEHVAYQTFLAYYAGRASETQGMGKPDAGVLGNVAKEAVDAATGGVIEWDPSGFSNSRKLPLPYGMPRDKFHDAVRREWEVVKRDEFKRLKYDDIQLRPLGKGNGMYVVQIGTEDQVRKDGSLMVMDIAGYVK